MHINIISVAPELMDSPFAHSIMKRAKERGLLHIHTYNLRKCFINKHGQIDDYQYGGGAGMVIMCEPLINAIEELQQTNTFDEIIYMTPDTKF
jgi:tRNA (guanine37-N1)-methyltransferase